MYVPILVRTNSITMKLEMDILFDIIRCYSNHEENDSKWVALFFSSTVIAHCTSRCTMSRYRRTHEIDCVQKGWLQGLKFIYTRSLNTVKLESLFNLTARGTTLDHLNVLKWIMSKKKITKRDIEYAIIESNIYGNGYAASFLEDYKSKILPSSFS